MTELPESSPHLWGLPPTLGRNWRPTSDGELSVCIYNLKNKQGFTIKTSRPYIVAAKMMHEMVPGLDMNTVNRALARLFTCGTAYVKPEDSSPVAWVFYLAYEEEWRPFGEMWEADPKLIMNHAEIESKLEGMIVRSQDENVPVEESNPFEGF